MSQISHFIEGMLCWETVDSAWAVPLLYESSRNPHVISGQGELPDEEGDFDQDQDMDQNDNPLLGDPVESQIMTSFTPDEPIEPIDLIEEKTYLEPPIKITEEDLLGLQSKPLASQLMKSAFNNPYPKQVTLEAELPDENDDYIGSSPEHSPTQITRPQEIVAEDLDIFESRPTNPLAEIIKIEEPSPDSKFLKSVEPQVIEPLPTRVEVEPQRSQGPTLYATQKKLPNSNISQPQEYSFDDDDEGEHSEEGDTYKEPVEPEPIIDDDLIKQRSESNNRPKKVSTKKSVSNKPVNALRFKMAARAEDEGTYEVNEDDNKIQYKQRTVGSRPNEDSFQFEDESFDDDFEEAKPEEDSNFRLLAGPVDQQTQRAIKKRIYQKSQIAKIYCMIGFFIFFFLVSSVLWIILFRDLSNRNNYLSSIILHPPTLNVYYQLYRKFFKQYDYNRDRMLDIANVLNKDKNPNYKAYKGSFLKMDLRLDEIYQHMAKIKKGILDLQEECKMPKGRKLADSSFESNSDFENKGNNGVVQSDSDEDEDDVEIIGSLSDRAKLIQKKIEKMQGNFEYIQTEKSNFNFKEKKVVKTLNELYSQAFELIDLYGEFYIMTNRIWVTSDNIYRLFQGRAKQIIDEIAFDHFDKISQKAQDIKLLPMGYNNFASIEQFPPIKIKTNRPTFLICSVRAQIDNSELKDLNHDFELSLVANQRTKQLTKSQFLYTVTGKRKISRFVTIIKLTKEVNHLRLFARVQKGQVSIKEVNLECFQLYSFLRFPEYEK